MSRLVVSISHVEFTETDQTFYVVKVQQDADEWQVRRSYTDFRHLRDDVQRVLKDDKHQLVGDDASRAFARGLHDLQFPGRRLFGAKSDRVVKERAVELHHFLIKLLFLTHTYRKAQKQLYDAPDAHLNPTLMGTSMVARPQGSASVFYLLRDFLKSSNESTSYNNGHGGPRARGSKTRHTDDERDDDSDHARRMLRESKMLAMRTSQQKTMSAPQLLNQNQSQHPSQHQSFGSNITRSRTNTNGSNASTPRRAAPPRPARPMAPEAAAAVAAAMEDLTIEPVRKSVHFQSHDDATTVKPSDKTMSFKAASFTAGSSKSPSSPVGRSDPIINQNGGSSVHHKRFNDRISSAEPHPVLRAIGSDLHIIESIPDPQPRSLSSSSTASSTASFQARSLEAATALSSSTSALDSSSHSSGSSARRRPRSKKKSMSASSSSLTAAEKEMRDSLRLSRLTPQLTAQTITVNAQKELEKHVSEYNAIMVMRYVDRFICKAVAKTPGCYTVMGKRLVIDSARFVTELDEVFHDLPSAFQDAFKNALGEWVFPPALDAYVQMKWDSFQTKQSTGLTKSDSGTKLKHKSSSRSKLSDSDDSDSDYEYEEDSGAGYMKTKDRTFTQEESDVLQMMIADGTAGRDQMLRLRRQFDEQGWKRRNNPGAKYQASRGAGGDDGSDTDDDDNGSGNESFKRFQQQQNAMRKSRMSHHDDLGGLV